MLYVTYENWLGQKSHVWWLGGFWLHVSAVSLIGFVCDRLILYFTCQFTPLDTPLDTTIRSYQSLAFDTSLKESCERRLARQLDEALTGSRSLLQQDATRLGCIDCNIEAMQIFTRTRYQAAMRSGQVIATRGIKYSTSQFTSDNMRRYSWAILWPTRAIQSRRRSARYQLHLHGAYLKCHLVTEPQLTVLVNYAGWFRRQGVLFAGNIFPLDGTESEMARSRDSIEGKPWKSADYTSVWILWWERKDPVSARLWALNELLLCDRRVSAQVWQR